MMFGPMTLRRALRNRQEPESIHVFANVFWQLLLASCVAIAIFIVSYNVWVYVDVNRALSSGAPALSPSTERPPFDKAKLSALARAIVGRSQNYQIYSTQAPSIPDPSRPVQATSTTPTAQPKRPEIQKK